MSNETVIKFDHVTKEYRLGEIGGGTLKGDLQSWWARKTGKEDPNSKVGSKKVAMGEKFLALDDISFEVKKGEAVGIIGHNGAGKSTLLKLLCRVTGPTKGTISYNGRVASMLEVGTGFHPEMTGRENIYMNGAILGMTKAEIDAKIEDIIDFSEVRDFIDTPVKRYSSGMYVKLAFSVAAHLDSEIMIMDEVLAVGDMAFQKKCLAKMREAADKEGRTILYVSHNMNTIRQLCDRCIVLDHGCTVFDGNVESGINTYLKELNTDSYPPIYDFLLKPRFGSFGQKIFAENFMFINCEQAVFPCGKTVSFAITLNSNVALDCMSCVLRVKDDSNSIKVATFMSDRFSVNIGRQTVSFSIDLSCLVADKYCISFEIICFDENNNYLTYDNPDTAIAINLIDDKSGWAKQYWGNVRLPNMHILNTEVL